jgi:HK97 family phage prohead protease
MKLEHKSFKARVKAEDEGILEAIVSVFGNVDQAEERVLPGFFQESLAQKMPKGVWMHDWTAPVAKTLEAREILPGDPLLPDHLKELGGLYIKGQFNLDTQRGREAFSDLKFGIVDEFSIGYRNIVTQYDEEDKVLNLVKGELYEWSPVLVGCNRETALLSAKGMTFDQQFTDLGFSGLPDRTLGGIGVQAAGETAATLAGAPRAVEDPRASPLGTRSPRGSS